MSRNDSGIMPLAPVRLFLPENGRKDDDRFGAGEGMLRREFLPFSKMNDFL